MKMRIFSAVAGIALAGLASGAAVAQDWSGAYVGAQLGYLDVDGPGAVDGDDVAYGLHAGYNYDLGSWVIGGELELDWTDVSLGGGAATVDRVFRAKVKLGYDAGAFLPYVTVGYADVDTSLGSDGGGAYGLGAAYRINDQWSVSAEALYHDFNNINGTGVDADATSVNLRVSFNF